MNNYKKWDDIVLKLLSWTYPGFSFGYAQIEEPSHKVIFKAIEKAHRLQKLNEEPPLRVIPVGNGDVRFEWWDTKDFFKIMKFNKDGTTTVREFKDCKVIKKYNI